MVLCGDLYQAQPIQDSLIFEKLMVNMQTMTHGDAGASSAKHKWRKTQHPNTHFEVFLNFKVGISM